MASLFQRATKERARLRMALVGPAGSGKTYTALAVAAGLGERVAVLDTEHGSASKYAGLFSFDSFAPDSFEPEVYMDAIREAGRAGYDVLILDSLSHAWSGRGGLLEFVDEQAKRSRSGSSFTAWRDATPRHNALVEAMLAAQLHLIVTMRAKTEFVMERDEKTGKSTPRKIGMQPVQRDGLEYEFDVVGDLTFENDMIISKTRCPSLQGKVISRPGAEFSQTLRDWLTDGVEPAPPPEVDPATEREFRAEIARLGSSTRLENIDYQTGEVVDPPTPREPRRDAPRERRDDRPAGGDASPAKFGGTCVRCGGRYEEGTPIFFEKRDDGKWDRWHEICPVSQANAPERSDQDAVRLIRTLIARLDNAPDRPSLRACGRDLHRALSAALADGRIRPDGATERDARAAMDRALLRREAMREAEAVRGPSQDDPWADDDGEEEA